MKPNKTKTFIFLWIVHMYIYYISCLLIIKYSNGTLYEIKDDFFSIFFILPLISIYLPIIDGFFMILIPIIFMYYLIWHKKYRFFKSYYLSILIYYITVNIIYVFNDIYIFDTHYYRFTIYFICLVITISIIWLLFYKKFKKLDKEYNLK